MIAGPAHGRPMQLVLMNEGGGVDQQPGGQPDGIDNAHKGKLKRSESTAYESCLFTKHLTLKKFSAYSFYPGRGDSSTFLTAPSRFEIEANPFNAPDGDTDVESENEDDWFEPQATELAQSAPSKMSEAVAIEVRRRFLLSYGLQAHGYVHRGLYGRLLLAALLDPMPVVVGQ